MRLSKKFAAVFGAACLTLAGLAGCSGSGDDNAKPEATEQSTNAKCAGCTEPVGGFKEGEYGFDGTAAGFVYKNHLWIYWDRARGHQDAAWPEVNGSDADHSPRIDYTTFSSGIDPEIDKNTVAKDIFTKHSDSLLNRIDVPHPDGYAELLSLNESSGAEVKIGQWTMYRSEGTIPCDGHFYEGKEKKDISTPPDYVGYSLVLDGNDFEGENGKMVAVFVVVDNPAAPVGKKVLSDIAKKTAESFYITDKSIYDVF